MALTNASRRKRMGWVLWALPIVVLPLVGALVLHVLHSYADDRQQAALQLETLGSDLNNTSAALGWAVANHALRQTAQPAIDADIAGLNADTAALATYDFADSRLREVDKAVSAFTATLAQSLDLLDKANGLDPTDLIGTARARATQNQHDIATGVIERATESLAHDADTANLFSEIGIWVIVLTGSAGLVVLIGRADVRRRRVAVADARRATLEENERTYRLLFQQNPAPMYVVDPESLRILAVNRAMVAKYGYSEEEFRSMTAIDLRPADDREAYMDWLSGPALTLARMATIAGRHLLKSGGVIDVELTHDDVELNGKLAKLALVRDVTDQRRLEAELHDRAFHDVLTGLANRALLADRFEHAQAVRTREDRGLAVMVIDVDGFKAINDMLGHAGGDGVLREVAQRLRSAVRSRDTVGRLGGDEFAVIFDGADPSDALDLAQRVLSAVDAPMEVDGRAIEVVASAGLTSVHASDVTWEAAMQHADVAMYEAKTEGKSSVRVYETGMQSLLLQRLSIASELKRAIAADEMTLHYQPIVPTDGEQQREQVEALIRWQHPSRGLVPPMEFIPIAEQTGTIVQLGTWVLRAACRQIAEWRDQGRLVRVSVNVSGRQLRESDFADVVTHVLADTKVPADQLVLEVTETALLEDLKRASVTLNKLRARGIQVALDDFGAGYSSINYLNQLPVDVVKIDRAFVISLDKEEKRAVVLTIMRLLGTMKVRTVAEGVETSTQLGYVTSLGIDACQGYLFSPAVPAHDVLAVLDRCSPKMRDARAQTPIAVV